MPGPGPDDLFRRGPAYRLPAIPDGEEFDEGDAEPLR
jgi:hypothetical protein